MKQYKIWKAHELQLDRVIWKLEFWNVPGFFTLLAVNKITSVPEL